MQKIFSKYIVLGGGISGLTLANELKTSGKQVLLIEKNQFPGGVLQSLTIQEQIWDRAAHTIAVDNELNLFFEKYNLNSILLNPSPVSRIRMLNISGKIKKIPTHPFKILSASFLSFNAKMELIKEFWKKPIPSENPTVYELFSYHFGQEITRNIISSVFSGIYAGDIERMEMRAAMPSILELEREHGSILKGMFKSLKNKPRRKIIGIKGGTFELCKKLANLLDQVIYDEEIVRIQPLNEGFYLFGKDHYHCEYLISALPSYNLASLVSSFDNKLGLLLEKISYSPVILLHVAYKNIQTKISTKSFGFLCSQYHSPYFRGAIFNSSIFPERVNKNNSTFSIFISPDTKWLQNKALLEKNIEKIINTFSQLMGIQEQPFILEKTIWKKGIPQFNYPYLNTKEQIFLKMETTKNFYLSGSYISGVSVSDCIKYNSALAIDLIRKEND